MDQDCLQVDEPGVDATGIVSDADMLQHWLVYKDCWLKLSGMGVSDVGSMFGVRTALGSHMCQKYLEYKISAQGFYTRCDPSCKKTMVRYFFPYREQCPDYSYTIAMQMMDFFVWSAMMLYSECEDIDMLLRTEFLQTFRKHVDQPITAFDGIEDALKPTLLGPYVRIMKEELAKETVEEKLLKARIGRLFSPRSI